MKYAIILSLILLLISGCAHKKEEETASLEQEPGTKTQAMQDDNKQSELAKIVPGPNTADPSGFENLASQYSQAVIKTNFGEIKVKFYNEESPKTVNNFLNLAKIGLYNGTRFHRVIADFMIQGGDPNSKGDDWTKHGMGGPGYKFNDEINSKKLVKGSLAMANSGPNTNGSQFFIVTADATPWLDGKHANFGEVVEGTEVIDKIKNVETNDRDHPLKDVVIISVELIK